MRPGAHGVELVIDATGRFRTREALACWTVPRREPEARSSPAPGRGG
ncbi:hypothetical protein [Nonomuraea sp. NPDC048826]